MDRSQQNAGLSEEVALERALTLSLREAPSFATPDAVEQRTSGRQATGVAAQQATGVVEPYAADAAEELARPLSNDEWLEFYVADTQHLPHTAKALLQYAKFRGGTLTYAAARHVFYQTAPMRAPARTRSVIASFARTAAVRSIPQLDPVSGAGYRGARTAAVRPNRRRDTEPQTGICGASGCYLLFGPFPEDDCCAICLAGEGTCVEMRCKGKHRFHQECIDGWLSGIWAPKCPTCRESLVASHVFQNHPEAPSADARASDGPDLQLPIGAL